MQAQMRRLFLTLLLMALAGCSSLTLGYDQLPRLLGWWLDDYVDLDRTQQRQLDAALQQMHDWHRREELSRWQALLTQAERMLEGGFDDAELLQLETALTDSLRRTAQKMAPLAAPLLASLKPEQWAQMQRVMAEKQQAWREREQEQDADERGERYVKALERWFGDLPLAAEKLARRQAAQWPTGDEALWHERKDAQARTLEGLRAWAANDLDGGTRLLLASTARDGAQRGPATQALRTRSIANVVALTKLLDAAAPRARWARWQSDLQQLRNGG
jgi:Spy/CpxP family protein refolding chaperone